MVFVKKLEQTSATTIIKCEIPTFTSGGILPRVSNLKLETLDANGDPFLYDFIMTLMPAPIVTSITPSLSSSNFPTEFVVLIDQMPVTSSLMLQRDNLFTKPDTFAVLSNNRIKIGFTLPPCSSFFSVTIFDNVESPIFRVPISIGCATVRVLLSIRSVDFGNQVAIFALQPWMKEIPQLSHIQAKIADDATRVVLATLSSQVLQITCSLPSHVVSSFSAEVTVASSRFAADFVDTRDVLSAVQVEITPDIVSWLGGSLKVILKGAAVASLRLKHQMLLVTFGNTACDLKIIDSSTLGEFFVAEVTIQELAVVDRNGADLSLSTAYGLKIARRRIQVESTLSCRLMLTNSASGLNIVFSSAVDKISHTSSTQLRKVF